LKRQPQKKTLPPTPFAFFSLLFLVKTKPKKKTSERDLPFCMATARECLDRGKQCHLSGNWAQAREWFLCGAEQYQCLECRTNLVRARCWAGSRCSDEEEEEEKEDTWEYQIELELERIHQYAQLVQLSEQHPTYTYNLACRYARAGDMEHARHWFRKTAHHLATATATASNSISRASRRRMLKTMRKQLLLMQQQQQPNNNNKIHQTSPCGIRKGRTTCVIS